MVYQGNGITIKVSKKQFFQTEKVEENQAVFYKLNTGRKYIFKDW